MNAFPSDDRPGVERRRSYRFRAQQSPQSGRLRVDKQEVSVEILDESADGFCVLAQGAQTLWVGATFLLETGSGCAEVQVRNLSQQEVNQTIDGVTTTTTVTRLGLERLRDVPPWETAPQNRWQIAWLEFRLLIAPARAMARLLVGTAILLVIASLVAAVVVWKLEHPPELDSPSQGKFSGHGRLASPVSSPTFGTASSSAEPKQEPTVPPIELDISLPDVYVPSAALETVRHSLSYPSARSRSNSSEPSLDVRMETADSLDEDRAESPLSEDSSPETISLEVLRQSAPAVLLQPEIVGALMLHQEQKDELLRLANQEKVAGRTDGPSHSNTPQAEPTSPSDPQIELGRRALAILSKDQLRRWIHLLSETDDRAGQAP